MKSMYVVFALVVSLLIGLMSWYLYARLVRAAHIAPKWYWLLLIVLWVSAGPLAMVFRFAYGYNFATVVATWVGWTLTGILYLFLSFLIVRDIGLWLYTWFQSTQGSPLDPDRRALFVRTTNLALAGVSLAVAANGVRAARRTAEVIPLSVPIRGLPRALQELKVVQISDIHIGDTIGEEYLSEIVARVMEREPDLIVITGDLIDGKVREIGTLLDPLDDLQAPLGVYFITGNHEYYFNVEAWLREIESHGITTLVNEHVVIRYRGYRIVLGGIPDHDGGRFLGSHEPDVEQAFEGAPDSDIRVLLAHQPRSYPLAKGQGVDLQLSGHTHGGQVWPFGLFVPLQQYFSAGLHRVHEDSSDRAQWLYISRGTGYWGPPMRVGAPSEITDIRFVAAETRSNA
jgi:predicted MPP superfamily phosphohydrolase